MNQVDLLSKFNERCDKLRDIARGVGLRYRTGAYIVGRPGTSKSWSVREELEAIGVAYASPKGRVTGPSLYDLFAEAPEHTIVLDDLSNLYNDKIGIQILLAALDGDPKQARKLTYKTRQGAEECWFTGGVICISNLPLKRDPLADALRSRVQLYEHEPTDDEVAAFVRELAYKGDGDLTPSVCTEVAEFLIEASKGYSLRIDLRFYPRALSYRRQWEHGQARTPWQTMLHNDLGMIVADRPPITKDDEKGVDRWRVREAMEKHPDDWRKQVEASGLSKATFYRRKRELQFENA